ncbi:MAG: hypothetical protein M3O87_05975 [Candidatus Dormibacteraeota bacterium]|nr:hypothetical protein [Candidatus Dormibacteraeota bacterium]
MADADPPPPPAPELESPPATPPPAVAPATLSPDRRHVWNGQAWVPASFSADGAWVWDGTAWLAAPPPPPAPVVQTGPVIQPVIDFDFPVGKQETHKVHVRLDQASRQLTIDVDGEYVVNEMQQFSLSMMQVYRFNAGTGEPHAVIVEKRREVLMSGSKPYTWRVFVDDQYVGTYQGEAWLPT